MLASGTATSDLTGPFCQATTVQWALDTPGSRQCRWAAPSRNAGGKSWYFVSFDYAPLGKALQRDTAEAVERQGGKILGSVTHPLGTADFSSYLLQAQSSGADVIALGDTGTDAINAIKQISEFQILRQRQAVAPHCSCRLWTSTHSVSRRPRGCCSARRSIGISTITRGPGASASPSVWTGACRR